MFDLSAKVISTMQEWTRQTERDLKVGHEVTRASVEKQDDFRKQFERFLQHIVMMESQIGQVVSGFSAKYANK